MATGISIQNGGSDAHYKFKMAAVMLHYKFKMAAHHSGKFKMVARGGKVII